jgi:DEAD/DEAH box helicase domain-containing protein
MATATSRLNAMSTQVCPTHPERRRKEEKSPCVLRPVSHAPVPCCAATPRASSKSASARPGGALAAAPDTHRPQEPPAPQPVAQLPGVDVTAVVARLQQTKAQVKGVSWVPARAANHKPPSSGFTLPPELGAVLGRSRALPLYSHQHEALAAALSGKSVVVSTPTASGKSICYLAPLLHRLSEEEKPTKAGRALVLMPLKALANDQVRAIRALLGTARACADAAERSGALPAKSISRLRRMANLTVDTYDGDVQPDQRADVRRGAVIVVTNIDMLHVAMLPHHQCWPTQFWAHLKMVVVDESHTYRGVYGSHASLVLRRLRRVCASYGSCPSFVCCSATVANPGAHVALLTGVEHTVVNESGAPSGAKALMLWQPPEATHHGDAGGDGAPPKAVRSSPYQEAGTVIAELVAAGLKPLVFVPARKLAEIVAGAARAALTSRSLPNAASRVESYRAGYTPAERRDLEQRLSSGDVSALVSTSALELGIDIGQLDATVHVGVPDTAAQQWQQAGRAGRRGGSASMAVIIATERPLDLFYLAQPDALAQRQPESAHIDPTNIALMTLHIAVAAAELKVVAEDAPLFGGDKPFAEAIRGAVNMRAIAYEPGIRAYGSILNSPALGISMRGSTSRETVELHDAASFTGRAQPVNGGGAAAAAAQGDGVPPAGLSPSLVESIEACHAPYKVHPGAVFHHRQAVYEVTSLDTGLGVALGKRIADSPFITAARERSTVREVRVHKHRTVCCAWAALGRCHVSSHVTGFVKMNSISQQVVFEREFPGGGYPALNMETDALWFQLPTEVVLKLQPTGGLREACAGLRNLTLALLPSLVACEPSDVGSTVVFPDPNAAWDADDDSGGGAIKIYVYDTHGGCGLCAIAYDSLEPLWQQCLAVVERCPCPTGCASCTQAGRSGREAGVAKPACKVLLQGLLGAWMHGGRASMSTGGTRSAHSGGKSR